MHCDHRSTLNRCHALALAAQRSLPIGGDRLRDGPSPLQPVAAIGPQGLTQAERSKLACFAPAQLAVIARALARLTASHD